MKLFFILYWGTFLAGYWAIRSYSAYHRQHVLRHEYAERHRRQIDRSHGRHQLNLF